MPEFHGSATTRVSARPDEVFDLITDLDRLPEWNACIESVVTRPPALEIGAEWVVKIHVPGIPRIPTPVGSPMSPGPTTGTPVSPSGRGNWLPSTAIPRSPFAGTAIRRPSGATSCSPASATASWRRR